MIIRLLNYQIINEVFEHLILSLRSSQIDFDDLTPTHSIKASFSKELFSASSVNSKSFVCIVKLVLKRESQFQILL